MGMLNFMDWLRKPTLIKSMSLDSIFMVGNETKEGYATEGITLAELTSSLQTLTIPKLHLHTEVDGKLGVTLMPTSASNLWAGLNPRIYLFHYKKTKGRRRKEGKKSNTIYKKGGFLHPTHMNGINFSNNKFYSGETDIPYHTEYDMYISKGYESQMLDDFNPFEFYSYKNDEKDIYFKPLPRGLNFSELNRVSVPGKGRNGITKANRSNYFKFAIGIDNPDSNAAYPIIFGEMSDVVQSVLYIKNEMVDIRLNVVPNGIKRAIAPKGAAKA